MTLSILLILGAMFSIGMVAGMVIMELWHHRLRRELEYAKARLAWKDR
jgi:uncharacterized membrane protein YciS (DUF1049 family)